MQHLSNSMKIWCHRAAAFEIHLDHLLFNVCANRFSSIAEEFFKLFIISIKIRMISINFLHFFRGNKIECDESTNTRTSFPSYASLSAPLESESYESDSSSFGFFNLFCGAILLCLTRLLLLLPSEKHQHLRNTSKIDEIRPKQKSTVLKLVEAR